MATWGDPYVTLEVARVLEAEQVIHHVAMGRTLYYHALGKHLYWQEEAAG